MVSLLAFNCGDPSSNNDDFYIPWVKWFQNWPRFLKQIDWLLYNKKFGEAF